VPAPGNVHGFFWFYFINEQVLRYLNRRVPRDYDTVPLLLFWGLLGGLADAMDRLRVQGDRPRSGCDRRSAGCGTIKRGNCSAIWAAVVMVFFSFSTRQEYYALPAHCRPSP
jgi:hypothetical protein